MDREKQELSHILSLVPFDVVSHGTLVRKGEKN